MTHVDASKKAIQWGKENQAASKLDAAKIRWLLDDAAKFAARDVRRGKTYHMILVDPPKFGRGPEGEMWDLFANLPALLGDLAKLLAPRDAAMVLTVYAIRASALAFDQLMREALAGKGGSFDSGELAIRSASGPLVPTSLFVRWSQTRMTTPKVITSLTNDRVKAIRALEMRKVRKETGLFVAEGASLLVTARDNGFVPETLVYQAGTAASGITRGLVTHALNSGAEVLEVSAAVLAKLASKDNPQTLLGVFRQRFADPPRPKKVGAMRRGWRSKRCAIPATSERSSEPPMPSDARGVILVGTTCDPYALESIRATMGSIFAVPIVKMERPAFLGARQGLARRRHRNAPRRARGFSRRALSRTAADRHGRRRSGI